VPEGLTDAQIIARLERLERNVRTLAESVGVALEDPSEGVDADVVALAQSGDRMGAAKLYAERTGVGFVEAQRVVGAL
jgi:ribosomal protein L7/L12